MFTERTGCPFTRICTNGVYSYNQTVTVLFVKGSGSLCEIKFLPWRVSKPCSVKAMVTSISDYQYLWSDAQREGGAVQVCVMPYCCTEVHASSVALKSPTVSLEIQTKAGYTIQAFSLHSTWCACYYDAFLSKVPNPMIHKAAVIIQLVVIELTFVMYHLTYPL